MTLQDAAVAGILIEIGYPSAIILLLLRPAPFYTPLASPQSQQQVLLNLHIDEALTFQHIQTETFHTPDGTINATNGAPKEPISPESGCLVTCIHVSCMCM